MADIFFNWGRKRIVDPTDASAINLLSNTIQAMLVNSSYVGAPGDQWVSFGTGDPAGSEISVTGYVPGYGGSGRKTLSGKTITIDSTNNRAVFTANNLTWTALGAGATIGAIVLYKQGTADANSPIIAKLTVGPQATNGSDVTVQWNANGILTF